MTACRTPVLQQHTGSPHFVPRIAEQAGRAEPPPVQMPQVTTDPPIAVSADAVVGGSPGALIAATATATATAPGGAPASADAAATAAPSVPAGTPPSAPAGACAAPCTAASALIAVLVGHAVTLTDSRDRRLNACRTRASQTRSSSFASGGLGR